MNFLQTDLVKCIEDDNYLHKLSSLLICKNLDDIKSKMNWSGTGELSRKKII